MWLEAELTVRDLHDAENFTALKAVARRVEHVWLTREEIERLAGGRSQEPTWREQFERMLEYAASKGWVNESGAIRVHVDWSGEPS